MLDCHLRPITDLSHGNRDETDMIMAEIRELWGEPQIPPMGSGG